VAHSLSLERVLALVGGLALLAVFFMPWFSAQGLLLSGQFLHIAPGTANPSELRRLLPSSSPADVQFLHALVDVFRACSARCRGGRRSWAAWPPAADWWPTLCSR
jgi:hypothetical protein